MIFVTGSATGREETFDDLRTLSLEHVRRSRAEPGCMSHAVHADCENALKLVFLEQWADRAALLAHLSLPASRDFARALSSLVSEPPSMHVYEARDLQFDLQNASGSLS